MAIASIDKELCTGCGECVVSCPPDVLRMEAEERYAEIRYPDDCMICEMCVRACPVGAITVTFEKTLPVTLTWE